jgi:acyl-CoA synthetase (AMP-forming)/AMP-acid ligase II
MIDTEAMPFLADVPRVQAQMRPEDTAFWFEGETTTYRELDIYSNQVANGLVALGVGPDDRVGYLAKNTSQYYEMLYGAAKARAVMTAVNTRLAAPEVQFILSDAGAKVLFVGRDFYDMAEQIRAELPDLVQIIAVDGGHPEWPDYREWRESQSAALPGLTPKPEDDVIQLYTSGTTGLPKGVQLTNANYRALFEQAGHAGMVHLWCGRRRDERDAALPCGRSQHRSARRYSGRPHRRAARD